MTTAASTVRIMNGSSQGAVSAVVTGYSINSLDGNQENQRVYKETTPGHLPQQFSTSSSRAPLSTIPSTQKVTQNFSRTLQSRTTDPAAMQADASGRAGTSNGSKSNGNLGRKPSYDDIPVNMYRPDKGDYEGWIHREKLAKIESEELQAAGINLAKARSRSRDALGERIREGSADRSGSRSGINQRDDKRRRLSPPGSQDEEERSNWDFRTPEEIAADQAAGQIYASPVLRKSGSKIPILTSSPTPISSERYERETPMPRKRTLSGSLTPDDTLAMTKTRSGGMDSDVSNAGRQGESPSKSRSKSTTVSRPGTSSGLKGSPAVRKVSTPVKSPSPNDGRPSTRGNDMDRPRTAINRPEGDPPWLATMYKPDPRLPPDQQLIPTLAKKQMQEQWALNGQIPKVYDRDFNSLAVHDDHTRYSSSIDQAEPHTQKIDDDADFQSVRPPPSTKSSSSQVKPALVSVASGTGGYSTMPKVIGPQAGSITTSNLGTPPVDKAYKHSSFETAMTKPTSQAPSSTLAPTTKIQSRKMPRPSDEQDEKAQKKGCCCIVM